MVSQNIVVNSGKATPSIEKEEVKGRDSDDTVIYSSDDTEAYWPLDPMKQILLFPKINVQQHRTTPVLKLSSVHRFHVHRIPHRKLCYYFKCVIAGCVKTFDKIHDWNLHHHLTHKTRIKCTVCGKKFITPSSHRAHKNIHAVHKFNCQICHKSYAFTSGLHQHKNFHNKSKKHRCFH